MADRGADLAAVARRPELTVLACHVPVKVTVTGTLGDEALGRLADSVEAAVGRRLAEAAGALPAGVPVPHPPGPFRFSGDLADPDRARLQEALRSAVTRATRPLAEAAAAARPAGAPVPGRPARPARSPAAGQAPAGATGFPTPAEPAGPDFGAWRDPEHGPAGEIREGGSPFDGRPIAALGALRPVTVYSPRHALAGTLTQAIQLGLVVFPAASFAILEGPDGTFWVVGTEPAVDAADLRAGLLPDALLAPDTTASGRGYRTRGLVTRDRRPVWRNRDAGLDWLRQLADEARTGVAPLLADQLRVAVVAGTDQLVAAALAGGPAAAARRPAGLDSSAFTLVPWESKAGYLRALLAATGWTEQRRVALEILASLSNGAEVDAVVALLRETGLHGRLFDDLDPDNHDLMVSIGERFPLEHGRLTVAALATLLRRFNLLSRRLHEEALIGVRTGPHGLTVPVEVLDEAHDSATALVHAGNDLGESVSTLFTSPQLVARALTALAQLLVTVRLATLGYRPAGRRLDRFLDTLPAPVLAAARGAERLGCGDRVLRRLRWRQVWEIASLFGPQGDVAAGAGEVTGDATGVLRFLGVLTRLGEPVDAGALGARLVTLAGALAAAHPDFDGVDEVTTLLAALPDGEVHRLGAALARTRVPPGVALDDLAGLNTELHAAAADALTAIVALKALAADGLSTAAVTAFRTLLDADGVGLPGTAAVAAALAAAEGAAARFAAAVALLPFDRIDRRARTGFLVLLAAAPGRADALARYGFEAYAALWRRAAAGPGPLDRRLDDSIAALAGAAARTGPVAFRRLLDRLAADLPGPATAGPAAADPAAADPAIADPAAAGDPAAGDTAAAAADEPTATDDPASPWEGDED